MQTFVPYPDFAASAKVLDRLRLGKQRVEAYQILRAHLGFSKGWHQHPATLMWTGHLSGLAAYTLACCDEWVGRGYADTIRTKVTELVTPDHTDLPDWWGDPTVHLSHQSNLLRKMPDHYGQFFTDVPDDLPYVWPTT